MSLYHPTNPASGAYMKKQIEKSHNEIQKHMAQLRREATMTDFKPKKGERVLLDGWVNSVSHGGCYVALTEKDAHATENASVFCHFVEDAKADLIHPHPGVPVAALVEEAEVAAKLIDSVHHTAGCRASQWWFDYDKLRAAREAAQEPKLKEGWVKVQLLASGYWAYERVHQEGSDPEIIYPVNVRTDPPQGGRDE